MIKRYSIAGIFLCFLLFGACDNPQDHEIENNELVDNQQDEITYKRFTQDEGDIQYTFEYPDNYKDCRSDDNDPPWVSCTRWENEGWLDSSIHITTWDNRKDGYNNAKQSAKTYFDRIEGLENDFEIIKKYDIEIDGINGLFFQSSHLVDIMFESDLKEPTIIINRYVFFDAYDYVWEITMSSIESVAEKDEAGWEHLIESFTFLD